MLYGLETAPMRKRQKEELEVAELKILRFSLRVTRMNRLRNEYIKRTAQVRLEFLSTVVRCVLRMRVNSLM